MVFGWRMRHAEFENSSRLLQFPVETTWVALDLMSDDDPLYVGRPGPWPPRGANFALQNCDFLLVIGARMDFPSSAMPLKDMARGAHKVMVDIDPAEIQQAGRHPSTLPICADAGAFLREMLRQRQDFAPAKDRACWNAALPGLEDALSGGAAGASRAERPGQHLSTWPKLSRRK